MTTLGTTRQTRLSFRTEVFKFLATFKKEFRTVRKHISYSNTRNGQECYASFFYVTGSKHTIDDVSFCLMALGIQNDVTHKSKFYNGGYTIDMLIQSDNNDRFVFE